MQGMPIFDFVAGGGALLLDQVSKRMVQSQMADRSASRHPFVRIRPLSHYRQLYRHPGGRTLLVAIWLAALVSLVLLFRSGTWFQSQTAIVGLALALGSAAGNLLDILRRHRVMNFIDLGWWPVFNLADAGMVAGVLIAFFA